MSEENNEIESYGPPIEPDQDANETKLKERRKFARGPYAVGMFTIVAIVAIVAISSGFILLQRAQMRMNEARERLALGQAAMMDGDRYLALYHFTMALELAPGLPGAHAGLGHIAVSNGHGDAAVAHFDRELEINPENRKSHLALGCLYALGCVPVDDPNEVRGYLLARFPDVVDLDWPDDLVFVQDPGVDALMLSVYHFQVSSENLPEDNAPVIGLALTHIANYDLDEARDRLSGLIASGGDEVTLGIAQRIIQDINREEQYRAMVGGPGGSVAPETQTVQEPPVASPPQDFSGSFDVLPPVPGVNRSTWEADIASGLVEGGFGLRTMPPLITGDISGNRDNRISITGEDLQPQPTVKPISHDIHLEESNEMVHTVRIANIYYQGSVGFREGETIVMPYTNTEVTVVESREDRITLEERGHTFVWVPGSVGWRLESVDGTYLLNTGRLDISAHTPGENEQDEDIVESPGEEPLDSEGQADEGESGEEVEATENELGPEVPQQ